MNVKKLRLISTGWLACMNVQADISCDEWYRQFEKALADYRPEGDPISSDDMKMTVWKDRVNNWSQEAFFPKECDAILNLWRAKQFDFLQLLWWSTREREKRLLILALFLGSDPEETSATPPFDLYCSRFTEKEARERKEEIECIRKYQSKLYDFMVKHYLYPKEVSAEEMNEIRMDF